MLFKYLQIRDIKEICIEISCFSMSLKAAIFALVNLIIIRLSIYSFILLMDYSREIYERSMTEIGDEHSQFLRLKVMQGHFLRNNEAYVLLHDKYELKRQIDIKEACEVYVNSESCHTTIVRLSDTKHSALYASINQEGLSLLMKITPQRMNQTSRSFDLQYAPTKMSYSERDLLKYTYLVLKSTPFQSPRRITLKDKDVVKFGRQFYLVGLRNQKEKLRWYDRVYHQENLLEGVCRICLCQEANCKDDYLISPCMCTGSCGKIHLQCLRKWMQNRVVVRRNQNIQTYNFSKMSCQICKCDLPKYVSINGSMIQILPINIESTLTLERLGLQQNNKTIHCINMDSSHQTTITIGRSDRNDIILDQVSISRSHARIVIDDTGASIFDCGSKYGTFVLMNGQSLEMKDATFMNGKLKFQISFENQ